MDFLSYRLLVQAVAVPYSRTDVAATEGSPLGLRLFPTPYSLLPTPYSLLLSVKSITLLNKTVNNLLFNRLT